MKDPLPRIPFVTWQLPQDHLIFLSVHMRGKKAQTEGGGKKEIRRTVPQGERGREHYTPPVFISISHQIRSLADKGASWHITSSLWRKLTRAGDSEWQRWWRAGWRRFFLTERKREGENKGEPDILAAQIHRAKWDEEEEEEKEERQETKRWRGTKNSITGLALTLTFIWQCHSLTRLFSAVTGEACPTFKAQINKSRCRFSNKETYGFNS